MERVEIQYIADVLAAYLSDGPKSYIDVKLHCAGLGINKPELKAARKELGVKTKNTGETWLWYVPEDDANA